MTKDEIIQGIKNESLYFYNLDEIYRNDKEIVLITVTKNGVALRLASKLLQNYKEVVLLAVKKNGVALRLASKLLQNYKEVLLAAVKQDCYALKFASKELQNDKKVVLEAVKKNVDALNYASKELQDEIGKNNPVKYLESYLLKQKLNENLVTNNKIVIRKNKI